MINRHIEQQKLRRALVLGLMLHMAYLPVHANAETRSEQTGLTPETREAVRGAGRALLQAKRRYIPPQDTAVLRDTIKRVRRQIVLLTTPPSSNTPIKINRAGASIVTNQSLSVVPDWQQDHADDIQQLSVATGELSQQCQTLRREIEPVVQSRSLVNSVMSFFTGSSVSQTNAGPAVITPVTSAVLTRLEQVESEVAEALALPAAERQQRLELLIVSLKFNDQRVEIDDGEQERKAVSPTLSSRTQHRQD